MYLRKVIRISADDSPNVRVAQAQMAKGLEPTGEVVVPGVIDWNTYKQRRRTWDKVRACIGLDGMFYEGAEVLLYPPDWLNESEKRARDINIRSVGRAEAIGIDTAEGGDNTVWSIVSKQGLIEQISFKTPDTAIITGRTIALIQKYAVDPNNVMFDQGGGGQEHADRLRYQGYKVRTVSFGESVIPDPVRHLKPFDTKQHERRERYTFKNRRAQMYWLLHLALDPINNHDDRNNPTPFAIPAEYTELRRQLAVMPMWYDDEGRVFLPPKQRRPGAQTTSLPTISEMLGCSPDEADSLVLAMYAMDPGSRPKRITSVL